MLPEEITRTKLNIESFLITAHAYDISDMSICFISSVMFLDPIHDTPFLQPSWHLVACVSVSDVQCGFASKLRLLNLIRVQRINGTRCPVRGCINYSACE